MDTDYYSLYQTGRTLYNLKRYQEAAEWLKLAAQKPDNPSLNAHAHILLSQICQKSGDLTEAEKYLLNLTRLRPDYGPGHYFLGRLWADQKPQQAAMELTLALSLNLADPGWGANGQKLGYAAAFLLARLHTGLNNLPRAQWAYEKAAGLDAHRPEPWVELARLAMNKSQLSQARQNIQKALNIAPGLPSAKRLAQTLELT
jgi:tetratricopeptide (TPR) repeat protein